MRTVAGYLSAALGLINKDVSLTTEASFRYAADREADGVYEFTRLESDRDRTGTQADWPGRLITGQTSLLVDGVAAHSAGHSDLGPGVA